MHFTVYCKYDAFILVDFLSLVVFFIGQEFNPVVMFSEFTVKRGVIEDSEAETVLQLSVENRMRY